MNTRTVRIVGNWRVNGPKREWAGTGTLDAYGQIECAADLGDQAYDTLQSLLDDGQTDGSFAVTADDGRVITYYFDVEELQQ